MFTQAKILVVEDEALVALVLQDSLIKAGYDVPDVATSAEEALGAVDSCAPDLILMDIHIKGPLDGIETALEIHKRCHTPIMFVTAFRDPATLLRARQAIPCGFFVKPVQFGSLTSSIDMAIHKARMDQRRLWLSRLGTAPDSVFATDVDGKLEFANSAAQQMLRRGESDLLGLPLETVLSLKHGEDSEFVREALRRALCALDFEIPPETFLCRPDKTMQEIGGSVTFSHLTDDLAGVIFSLHVVDASLAKSASW